MPLLEGGSKSGIGCGGGVPGCGGVDGAQRSAAARALSAVLVRVLRAVQRKVCPVFLLSLSFFTRAGRRACLGSFLTNQNKPMNPGSFFSVFVTFFVTVIAALVLDFPVFHESWHLAVILRDILRQTRHFRET